MIKKYIIGIDLGGTNLKLGLLDLSYRIRSKRVLSTKAFKKKEGLIRAIVNAVNLAVKDKKEILGLGLGLPGPIDTERGIVHFFPNIPGWREVRLKKILQAKLRLPVFVDNDANLMSLAESRLGAARGLKNVICLTLGTGVGAGIIIGRTLYRGSTFSSGEIGHLPVNEKGPRCNCGGIACLEAYVGNTRIMKMAKAVFGRSVSLEELSLMAKSGNKKAINLWHEAANHLGVALAGITNVFDPDAIVIGGGVAQACKILFDKIRQVIMERAMSVQAHHVKVLKASLGNDAGLIGAAILVKEGYGL